MFIFYTLGVTCRVIVTPWGYLFIGNMCLGTTNANIRPTPNDWPHGTQSCNFFCRWDFFFDEVCFSSRYHPGGEYFGSYFWKWIIFWTLHYHNTLWGHWGLITGLPANFRSGHPLGGHTGESHPLGGFPGAKHSGGLKFRRNRPGYSPVENVGRFPSGHFWDVFGRLWWGNFPICGSSWSWTVWIESTYRICPSYMSIGRGLVNGFHNGRILGTFHSYCPCYHFIIKS